MNAIETLISVLCGPEGKCCISGSDDDRRLIDSALAELTQATAAPAGDWLWVKLMDFCKKRGFAPADFNDLFEIVDAARAARTSTCLNLQKNWMPPSTQHVLHKKKRVIYAI